MKCGIVATDEDIPVGGLHESRKNPKGTCLASPVGTDQSVDFTFGNAEINAANRDSVAVVDAQVAGMDGEVGCGG